MERSTLKKHEPVVQGDVLDLGPGEWALWDPEGDGRWQVVTTCGQCGAVAGCLVKHSIEENGEVNASYVCSATGCGWHVFVRLDGWDLGRKDAGVAFVKEG